MSEAKKPTEPTVRYAPPIPATRPPRMTLRYLFHCTRMPTVSAATGCSPTARTRSPHRDLDRGERVAGVERVRVGAHDPVVQVVGQPERDHVEHHADDDLIHQEHDREYRQHRSDQAAGQRPADQPEPDPAGHAGHGRRDECAGEQLALDRDVDDAGPLAQQTGQGAEHQRDGRGQGPLQQVDDLEQANRLARVRPGPQRQQEAQQAARYGEPLAPAGEVDDGAQNAQADRDRAENVGGQRPGNMDDRQVWRGAGQRQREAGVAAVGEQAEHEYVDQAERDERARGEIPAADRDRHAYRGSQRGHPDHPFDATAWGPVPPVARSRNSSRISGGAATKSTIRASMTLTTSDGTPVAASMTVPPASSAPNSSPARSTPHGRARPSSATVMPSKPNVP